MGAYMLRRLLATIPVLLIVALVTFGLLHLTPGDPAAIIAGDFATPEDIAKTRERMGLNKPIWTQMGIWFNDVFHGDFGESIFSGKPVLFLIKDRLEPTISLAILAELMAVVISIPLGIAAAWKANTWIDRAAMVFAVAGFSIPVFWLGFNFIWLFSVKLRVLPVMGYTPISEGLWPWLERLILPSAALGLIYTALITRMTRASTLEILREDYIRTARAKGLGEQVVLIRHALRNAALPIITVIGLGLAGLLAGVVITETVFAIPGVGRLVVDAVVHRDYPVIQGVILLAAGIYVFANLAVDLTYGYFDPRVKYR